MYVYSFTSYSFWIISISIPLSSLIFSSAISNLTLILSVYSSQTLEFSSLEVQFESLVYLPCLYLTSEYMEYSYNNALMSFSANSVSALGQFQLIFVLVNGHVLLLLCTPGNLCMPKSI